MDKLSKNRQLTRQGRRIAARYREDRRRTDRLVLEAESGAPGFAEHQSRIRAATRAGRAALKSRQVAQRRLTDALRRLIRDGLSIREAAERVGVGYHEGRQLIRAAEVTDKRLGLAQEPNVS